MVRNQAKTKAKIVELLKQFSVVSSACKQVGLPRATFYRWLKEDKEFANNVNEAIYIGTEAVNDIAEVQLLQAIKNGEPWALRFWLNNRSAHYATPTRLVREIHHTKTMIPQADEPQQYPVALVQFMGECEHCVKKQRGETKSIEETES